MSLLNSAFETWVGILFYLDNNIHDIVFSGILIAELEQYNRASLEHLWTPYTNSLSVNGAGVLPTSISDEVLSLPCGDVCVGFHNLYCILN